MPKPLVSVIIPTLNRPNFLKMAIVSVLNQDFKDFEIIVINDGGADVKVITDFFQDSRIKYFQHETRKGLPAARNTGIRHSQGKYLAYLDDDDIYYPNHFSSHLAVLNERYQLCYSSVCYAYKNYIGDSLETYQREIADHSYDLEKILIDLQTPPYCFMHEKACLDKVGLFDETLPRHEDWDLWIRIFNSFKAIHLVKVTGEYTIIKQKNSGGYISSINSWVGYFLNTMQIIHSRYRDIAKRFPRIEEKQLERRELLRKWCLLELDKMSDEQIASLQPANIMLNIAESSLLNYIEDVRGARALCGHFTRRLPNVAGLWLIYEKLSELLNDPFQAEYARRQLGMMSNE